MLRHCNCNILSVEERNKLEKSTFEFPSIAKSQTLGILASRCVLKSTSSYSLDSFLSTQVNENKFEQHCNSFPWLQGQSTKGELFLSFKCSFHHFKSSAEAIQLREPLVAIVTSYTALLADLSQVYCPKFIERSGASLHFWGQSFPIRNHFISSNTMIQLPGRMFVIYKLLVLQLVKNQQKETKRFNAHFCLSLLRL